MRYSTLNQPAYIDTSIAYYVRKLRRVGKENVNIISLFFYDVIIALSTCIYICRLIMWERLGHL